SRLSHKQSQVIAALLEHPTIVAAAASLGMSDRGLRKWLNKPDFVAAYRRVQHQLLERTVAQSLAAGTEAVAALRRNLTCGQAGAEIRAAVAILEHAVKGVEVLNLAEQVAELERWKAEQTAGPAQNGRAGWPARN